MSVDPIGDDIDQALARCTAVNDRDDQVLQTITQNLITDPPPQAFVPDNPADNDLTGSISPDNLASLWQAAETAVEKGDYRQAVGIYASLARASTRLLGPEHPDTLAVRNSLAWWRGEAGDVEGAAAGFAELLPVVERVLGPEHPRTLAVRNNLARWRLR
ncbi:tetratricopeptide repeat protein [Streptomyces massasporeus]